MSNRNWDRPHQYEIKAIIERYERKEISIIICVDLIKKLFKEAWKSEEEDFVDDEKILW